MVREIYCKWENLKFGRCFNLEKIDQFTPCEYDFLLELTSSESKDKLFVVTLPSSEFKKKILDLNIDLDVDVVSLTKLSNNDFDFTIY